MEDEKIHTVIDYKDDTDGGTDDADNADDDAGCFSDDEEYVIYRCLIAGIGEYKMNKMSGEKVSVLTSDDELLIAMKLAQEINPEDYDEQIKVINEWKEYKEDGE